MPPTPSPPAPARRRLVWLVALALTVCVLAIGCPRPTGAHAELVETQPPVDGLLAAGPDRAVLRFSEPIATGSGSPALRLVDERGRDLGLGAATVDPSDAHRVTADLPVLGPGTYTVVWTTRSATDGHALSGTYAFRVGGGRVPGAATTAGETPRAWAVATRWLTFLGAAVAAGGFFVARLVLAGPRLAPRAAMPARQRLRAAALAGTGAALLATLAEPLLQTLLPPPGALPPDLSEAIRSLPDAWWLRPSALLVLVGIAAAWLAVGRRDARRPATTAMGDRRTAWGEWAGLVVALVALLGLSLTGHGAARSDAWRFPALAANVLHQWSVALWVGGLAHLVLLRLPGRPAMSRRDAETGAGVDPIRRFSPLALGLVAVGVVTGVVNTGLILPALGSLWESRYGLTVLVKTAVLVPALALATWHRSALRRSAARVGAALRPTLRLETAVVALVVFGGSVLATSAPPAAEADDGPDAIVLAAQAAGPDGTVAALMKLRASPLRPGENTLTVTLADPEDRPIPLTADDRVRLDLISLVDDGIERAQVVAAPDGAGGFTATGLALSVDGWWRVTATVRRADQADLIAPFYLLVPDPNLHGAAAVRLPEGSGDAPAVFQRGLASLTGAQRYRYRQTIAGGTGTVYVGEQALSAPSGDQPAAFSSTSAGQAFVRIGEREWLRSGQGLWIERPAIAARGPAAVGDDYAGATGFQLGRVEEVNGEPSQIVTFAVAGRPGLAAAWYAWWVGTETGRVHRVTMVSRSHYMVEDFRDHDGPFTIAPPVPPGAPVGGTPAAS